MMTELSEECFLALVAETSNSLIFQYAVTQIKDKLMEAWRSKFVSHVPETALKDWKSGHGLLGKMQPKYNPTADMSSLSEPRLPTLKVCKMVNGHLSIPLEIRERWLKDPIRSNSVKKTFLFYFHYVFLLKTNSFLSTSPDSKLRPGLANALAEFRQSFCTSC